MTLPAPRTAILPPLPGYCCCAAAAKPSVVVEPGGVRLELWAYPELAMSGHVIVLPEGDSESGYANFLSGFNSQIYLLPGEVSAPERVGQAGQDLRLTAVNLYDQTIQWTQYTSLYVFMRVLRCNRVPIPEPAAPAVLAAGLLTGGHVRRPKPGWRKPCPTP